MSTSRDADEVTRDLVTWAGRQLPNIRVGAAPIGQNSEEDGVDIRLIRIAPRFEPRTRDRLNRTMALDYLLTVRFADPLAEHAHLAELAFAAMDADGYELVQDRTAAEACLSLGLKPAAGLILRAEARRTEALPRAPLVRHPAIMRLAPLGWIDGIVVGPGDVPIAGAFVTLEGGERTAVTGADGRFRFALPAGTTAHATARARSSEVTLSATAEEPVVLNLPLEA